MSKAKELFDESIISNIHNSMMLFKEDTDIIKEELDYAEKCHNLEKKLGCSLEEIAEFIRLLKKTYYINNVTGRLDERWSPFKSNEKELCKINNIFYKIKDKSE